MNENMKKGKDCEWVTNYKKRDQENKKQEDLAERKVKMKNKEQKKPTQRKKERKKEKSR